MIQLHDFCGKVGDLLSRCPESEAPARVAELLPGLLENRDLLRDDQKTAPATGYGRHDVFLCPNDRFSVIAAVWPAGFASPIHDHMTWCTFGVFEGVIEETRFEPLSGNQDGGDAVPVMKNRWGVGDVAHLPVGGGDIHGMYNPTGRPAISIHVYGGNSQKLGANVVNIYREAEAAQA
jgi:predicted metal-dependent enzyme (double-stranded beta helix superfamily)